eukprot:11039122-Alexandrium_andersonii.AAC.1
MRACARACSLRAYASTAPLALDVSCAGAFLAPTMPTTSIAPAALFTPGFRWRPCLLSRLPRRRRRPS